MRFRCSFRAWCVQWAFMVAHGRPKVDWSHYGKPEQVGASERDG
jgi:hypothetical protein